MDLQDGEERLWRGSETMRTQGDSEVDSHDTSAVTSLFSQSVSILGRGSVRQHSLLDRPSRLAQASTKDRTPCGEHKPEAARSANTSNPDNGFASSTKLGHLARILRSKNAGPYEITFDIMFSSESVYQLVRQSDMLNPKTASDALGLPQEEIIWCGFFDPARAFKVTIPRVRAGKKVAAGSFMEDDVHGSQQHLGLVNVELSETLMEGLAKL